MGKSKRIKKATRPRAGAIERPKKTPRAKKAKTFEQQIYDARLALVDEVVAQYDAFDKKGRKKP